MPRIYFHWARWRVWSQSVVGSMLWPLFRNCHFRFDGYLFPGTCLVTLKDSDSFIPSPWATSFWSLSFFISNRNLLQCLLWFSVSVQPGPLPLSAYTHQLEVETWVFSGIFWVYILLWEFMAFSISVYRRLSVF